MGNEPAEGQQEYRCLSTCSVFLSESDCSGHLPDDPSEPLSQSTWSNPVPGTLFCCLGPVEGRM